MSYEDYDLLGDLEEQTPHEFFYTDYIKKPNEYVNDDFADEYAETDPNEEYIDDILEDYLSVEDIDFSNLDGVDLREDFQRINEAISGRRVLGREYDDYSNFDLEDYATTYRRKPAQRPIARKPIARKTIERPIARKPIARKTIERPIARKPIARKPTERPIARKPVQRPIARPIERKPLQRPIAPKPQVKRVAERPIAKRPLVRPTTAVKPPLRPTSVPSQVPRQRPTVTAKGNINPKTVRQQPNDRNCNTTKRIIVPQDRKVIVEGVDKFILSNNKENDSIKNIGYYKGEKCQELVLIINNTSPNDFLIELFNPSSPLDYLFSSSDNLNGRIMVAGDNKVSYSDMLFNLLANPTLIPNAKIVVTNPVSDTQRNLQFNQSLTFVNKNIAGQEIVRPVSNALNIDTAQFQNEIVYFDVKQSLGRVFIPDGMDTIQYKVLAGNTVSFAFFYKQVSLKKFFFEEARGKSVL